AGVDFAEADTDGYRRAGAALLATGVTAFRPTFITAAEEKLAAALAAVPVVDIGPRIVGAHVEGPFISPARLRAHPARPGRPPGRRAPRPGPRAHAAPTRGGPGRPRHACARAPGGARARRPARRAGRRRRLRPQRRHRRGGHGGLRPRRADGHAPLQRDA